MLEGLEGITTSYGNFKRGEEKMLWEDLMESRIVCKRKISDIEQHIVECQRHIEDYNKEKKDMEKRIDEIDETLKIAERFKDR